jgi:uncharacterized protein YndB with AHSA1/START domain
MNVITESQPVIHSTFTIERVYPVPVARVYAAFENPATKRRWFAEGEGWHVDEFTLDFRVGGKEISRFRYKDGPPMRNDTIFLDVVPNQRIVLAYSLTLAEQPLSVSLVTVEFANVPEGTRLRFTEQGAFFDNETAVVRREQGSRGLLERLGQELLSAW